MMVPRPEVVGISVEMAPEEALRAVLESPYTRYPVFRESLDEIVGILHVRDLVSALHDSAIAEVELAALLRPAYVVPGDEGPRGAARRVPAHEPAHVGRRRRVRRDAGDRHARGSAGGDRRRDRGRVRPPRRVDRARSTRRRSGSTARSRSTTSTRSSERRSSTRTSTPSPGYVFDLIGRAAEPGDEVRTDGLRFTVLDVEGSRIQRIEVEFLPTPEPAGRQGRRGGVDQDRPTPPRGDSPLRHRDFVLFLGVMARDGVRRSRCRSSRSAGRSTRSTAIRSTSGSSGWRCSSRCRCSRCRPGTWPTASRAARCSRSRRARRGRHGRAALRHARPGPTATWPFFAARVRHRGRVGARRAGLAGDDAVARPARDPRAGARPAVGRLPGVRDRRARRSAACCSRCTRSSSTRSRRRCRSSALVGSLLLRAGRDGGRWLVARPRERARRRAARPAHAGAARRDLARPLRRPVRRRGRAAARVREGRPRRRAGRPRACSGPRLRSARCCSAIVLSRRPDARRHAGRTLLTVVGLYGVTIVVFGLSHDDVALARSRSRSAAALDMVSVVLRQTILPLVTPDELRGRVNAVEMVFISASNELGAFESGVAAALVGAVPAVVIGGVADGRDRGRLDAVLPGARARRPARRAAAGRPRRASSRLGRSPRPDDAPTRRRARPPGCGRAGRASGGSGRRASSPCAR